MSRSENSGRYYIPKAVATVGFEPSPPDLTRSEQSTTTNLLHLCSPKWGGLKLLSASCIIRGVADERQIEILRQGVQAWNDWRRKSEALIDLSAASLQGVELGSIDKDTYLNLWLSNLNNVDFADAELGGATLVNSEANQTVFRGADLAGCDFWGVENWTPADLSNSILYDTDFTQTTLLGADFTNSVMYGTIFAGVDLS